MRRRPSGVVLVFLLILGVIVAGAAIAAGEETGDDERLVHECAAMPPEDFADPAEGNDTIGWFDGYWYNEPLEIDASDGITPAELENLSARTAARFEALRCLTFDELPPIDIIDREDFANETAERFEGVSGTERQFDNAQFQTLLLIGDDQDSIEIREESRSVTVGGYYDFVNEEIVVISDNPEQLMIDEGILAHELGHALQDQAFGLEGYDRATKDRNNAKLGVIEGDVHRVEHEYLDHCEADRWGEPCIIEDGSEDGAAEPPNWGLYFMQFQPYSDGPSFVEYIYEQDGWEGVNELYDEMPTTSRHVIVPENYATFSSENLSVSNETAGEWERIQYDPRQEYNVIGKAGIASIFMDTAYDRTPPDIVDPEDFLNLQFDGEVDDFDPINYDLSIVDGWVGDQLHVYEHDNETATVWKTAWEDPEERAEFADAYTDLIEYRGGEAVDGLEDTWYFGNESQFDQAMTLVADGDRLWIVTAPTVDQLDTVHPEVQPVAENDTNRTTPGVPPDDYRADLPADENDEDDPMPAFGVVAGLLGLLLVRFAVKLHLDG